MEHLTTKKRNRNRVNTLSGYECIPWYMITKMRNEVNGTSDHHTRKETRQELIHCEDEGMPWYMITTGYLTLKGRAGRIQGIMQFKGVLILGHPNVGNRGSNGHLGLRRGTEWTLDTLYLTIQKKNWLNNGHLTLRGGIE